MYFSVPFPAHSLFILLRDCREQQSARPKRNIRTRPVGDDLSPEWNLLRAIFTPGKYTPLTGKRPELEADYADGLADAQAPAVQEFFDQLRDMNIQIDFVFEELEARRTAAGQAVSVSDWLKVHPELEPMYEHFQAKLRRAKAKYDEGWEVKARQQSIEQSKEEGDRYRTESAKSAAQQEQERLAYRERVRQAVAAYARQARKDIFLYLRSKKAKKRNDAAHEAAA
jgi:hypothetical protein